MDVAIIIFFEPEVIIFWKRAWTANLSANASMQDTAVSINAQKHVYRLI